MSITNLRKRYELAIGKVIGESFSHGEEDVAWWVTLEDVVFGECDTCGEPVMKPAARLHMDIIDPNAGRLVQVVGYFPTMLSPKEIREETRELINGYRISSLESDLSQTDHHHQDREAEDQSGD